MSKILVACNTLTSVQRGPYMDHLNLTYRIGRDLPKKFQFFQMQGQRNAIDRFRNGAFQYACATGMDYIFFIDDDMQLPSDAFLKLYKAKLDICAALNYIRGYPFDIMGFRWTEGKKHLEKIKDEDVKLGEVIRVAAIGTAVCLIDMKHLKKMPPPWFVTGPHNTEDVYFCLRATDYYKKLKIGIHCGVITGHMLEPEVISYYTKKHLLDYFEAYMTPEQVETRRGSGDRGAAYVKENIEPGLEEVKNAGNESPENP